MGKHRTQKGEDIDNQPVLLGKSSWEIGYVVKRFAKVKFERTQECD